MRCGLVVVVGLGLCACSDPSETREEPPPPTVEGCVPGEIEVDGACVPAGIAACAEGFSSDDRGGCIAPLASCEPGAIALPGDDTCRPVGSCAGGRWGDIPLAGAVFVDGAAAVGGDGSEAAPFQTIGDALQAAPAGAVVAIAAGSYAESVTVQSAVTLWGACAQSVVIVGAGAPAILVSGAGPGAALRNLSVRGSGLGVAVSIALEVVLEGVRVYGTGARGVDVEDTFGPASAELRGSLVEDVEDIGIFALGADVALHDSVVRGTRATSGSGRGISIQRGALVIDHSVVMGNSDTGVRIAGSSAELSRSVIRGTAELPGGGAAGLYAGGLSVGMTDAGAPSSAVISDLVIEQNANYGVLVEGSQASFERVVVRDTQTSAGSQDHGAGLQIQSDTAGRVATVSVLASLIERNRYAGINATGAQVQVTSTIVRETLPRFAGDYGRGVLAFRSPDGLAGVDFILVGSVVSDSAEAGLSSHGARVTIDRTLIEDSSGDAAGFAGRGASIQFEAGAPSEVFLLASLLRRHRDVGVYVQGSTAELWNTTIADTLPRHSDGLFGDGLYVEANSAEPAHARVDQSRVLGNARVGVASLGAGIDLGATIVGCNAIPLNGQDNAELAFQIQDLGGNDCGCEAESVCKILSEDIALPQPMAP